MTACPSSCVWFFLLLFYHTVPLFSQTLEIKGKISSKDSILLPQVVVILQKQDTTQVIGFTTSDEKGEWKISANRSTDFILTFRLLGYKTLFKKISTSNKGDLYFEITLDEDSYLLGVAEIKGSPQGITTSGDTLRYNLKHYTDGFEENLGDVINKLPGMEVSDQGQISYKGKRVNKLLIEGKDVLNNQHKIASTGIQANQLEGLEVIENFQEFGNSSFGSDDVALNIRLKKDYLGNWTGNIENQGGVENKFNSALNLLNIKDNFSVTSFVRANNTNEPVLNAQEYLDMQGSILRWINRLGSTPDFNTLVPRQFKPFQYVQKSLDVLGVINAAYTKSDKLKAKFSLLLGNKIGRAHV